MKCSSCEGNRIPSGGLHRESPFLRMLQWGGLGPPERTADVPQLADEALLDERPQQLIKALQCWFHAVALCYKRLPTSH